MASQDGQPDRILRGCTQPTLAQDLPEPAAGPPAGGALEAAAGPPARRWCFGGGGCAARDRRAHALRLLRAPGGSAAGRCVSELSHGRQTAPAPRPLVAGGFVLGGEAGLLYQQVTEQRQQNPDSRLKWETVEAAYNKTLQRFQRRTTRSSRGGPFLPIQAWLRRGFTAEQVRKGNYEEHPQLGPTYQLEIHDQGPAASPALRAEAAAKRLPRAKPPPSGPAAKRPPNPASHPSCRRRSRRCPARRPSGPAAANLLPALCPTSGPAAAKPARARPPPPSGPAAASWPRRPAVLPLLPSHARRVSNCCEPTLLRVRAGGDFL